jgi:hypothetical protein
VEGPVVLGWDQSDGTGLVDLVLAQERAVLTDGERSDE